MFFFFLTVHHNIQISPDYKRQEQPNYETIVRKIRKLIDYIDALEYRHTTVLFTSSRTPQPSPIGSTPADVRVLLDPPKCYLPHFFTWTLGAALSRKHIGVGTRQRRTPLLQTLHVAIL